jgi:hypothetical protein
MSDPTFVTQYRKEQIATFEQRYSILRDTCIREMVIQGNAAVFQVSGSGNASAVTRGLNGLIPYFTTDNTQNTCTLAEAHAPFQRSSFNIFATQGNMKQVMHDEAIGTLNRNIDAVIIAQLDAATHATGSTALTAGMNMIGIAQVQLGVNNVPIWEEDNMFGVISPAFRHYLLQTTEFANGLYVDVKPAAGPVRRFWRWLGINWLLHTGLTGIGGASEKCYLYHKRAMGHAANSANMQVVVGYNEEQDYTYARATLYHGAKLLQQTGIVQMLHDGSAYVST